MITFVKGNIFESPAQCLVNPVNCEGVMGKGLALQFKRRFPETFKSYRAECSEFSLWIGKLHVFDENGKTIVNFPTKDTWREASKIKYIRRGLAALKEFLSSGYVKSIAIPPLGCGLGGLDWNEVKPIICQYLGSLDVCIYLYEK